MSVFNSSNFTLQNIKDSAENATNRSTTNETVARAVNFALNIYQPLEARYDSQRYKRYTSSAVSISNTGYDLSLIGQDLLTAWATTTAYAIGDEIKNNDIGYVCVEAHTSGTFSTDLAAAKWEVYLPLWTEIDGFFVYRDSIRRKNLLAEKSQNEGEVGYYVLGDGKIYSSTGDGTSVFFEYLKRPPRFSLNNIVMSRTIPIRFEAEEMFENFVIQRYYKLKGQPALAQEAEAQFKDKLVQLFNQRSAKAIAI